jgi:integrase
VSPAGTAPDGTPLFSARIRLGDGTRTRVDAPMRHKTDDARKAWVRRAQADEDRTGKLLAAKRAGSEPSAPKGETVAKWVERWLKYREGKIADARHDASAFKAWIEPHIGKLLIVEVQRRDLERIVQALDEAVQRGDIRWKTAINRWGTVTKMFKDACRSKRLELRVRDDNPAAAIEGPDRGEQRASAYLFPAEFEKLMACADVPVPWRRVYALATYLYLRGGELAALDWESVNLALGYVQVHQALDSDTKEVRATKTKDMRKVPIEPALVPLLEAMHEESGGKGPVVPWMTHQSEWASSLRTHLDKAKIKRADLFANDATRRWIGFHDLRHSGITWRAVRGDEPLKIMHAAGHDDLRTTMIYVNEAHVFERGFGIVFPPLPPAVIGTGNGTREWPSRPSTRKAKGNRVSPGGFELQLRVPKKRQSRRLLDRQAPAIAAESRIPPVPPRSVPCRLKPLRQGNSMATAEGRRLRYFAK